MQNIAHPLESFDEGEEQEILRVEQPKQKRPRKQTAKELNANSAQPLSKYRRQLQNQIPGTSSFQVSNVPPKDSNTVQSELTVLPRDLQTPLFPQAPLITPAITPFQQHATWSYGAIMPQPQPVYQFAYSVPWQFHQ